MKQGNFLYHLIVSGQKDPYIVHRGVSQGGKKIRNGFKRREMWKRHQKPFPQGITSVPHPHECVIEIFFDHAGLKALKEKNWVVVYNFDYPEILTPKRIVAMAKKISGIDI